MNADAAEEKLTPAYYRHWAEERVRYRDLDALGHCNSAVYSTYFETGRVALLGEVGFRLTSGEDPFALVRQTIDYRQELMLDARLRIGTRIVKLGRSSIVMAAAVFEGDACAATAEIIGVLIDSATRRPREIPPALRAKLEPYL
jgi:acyl-CoA thioester hydrolase